MKNKLTILLLSLCFTGFADAQQAEINLGITTGQLCLEVTFKGEQVISASPLGMNIDHIDLGKSVCIKSVQQRSAEYKTYTIEKKDGSVYYLDTREFNDGIALRYRIPFHRQLLCIWRGNVFHFSGRNPGMVRQWPFSIRMDTSLPRSHHRQNRKRAVGSSRHFPSSQRDVCRHYRS